MNRLFLVFVVVGLAGCASSRVATYNRGYDRGRSDAVKQQYWVIQNQQKNLQPAPVPHISYVPVTTTYTSTNGVVKVPTTEYIRIEESP